MGTKMPKPLRKDDAHPTAAQVVSRVEPGDPPSETTDHIAADYDFMRHDSSDLKHLVKKGFERKPGTAYRWCEKDFRVRERWEAKGWTPVGGGKFSRGSTILCERPQELRDRERAAARAKSEKLLHGPMARFDSETARFGGRGVQPFDGSRSAREGMD